jgi:GMP synthase (glutamine-hydrolysing)
MYKHQDRLKLLLLQARREPRVRAEEHASFVRYTGLNAERVDALNVFDRPAFDASVIDGYDALLVGGASEASVLEPERYAFLEPSKALLLGCLERRIPVFASCFGFQLSVLALGGEVVRDEAGYEMGTIEIRLTAAARRDPLYRDTPDGFRAVAVHRERSPAAPPRCTELAYTARCCHSFKVDGYPFWAFQFHPEVDRAILIERLTIYQRHYTRDAGHLRDVLDSAVDTPESNTLLRKFVERVLAGA